MDKWKVDTKEGRKVGDEILDGEWYCNLIINEAEEFFEKLVTTGKLKKYFSEKLEMKF